jgi:hypothetical protein
LQGIASVAPWLLGSDTLDQLRKKGVFGWLKDPSTGTMTPVDISGQPVGNALQNFGGQPYPINPITGMPMAPGSGWANTSPSYYGQPDFVGPPAELVGPPTDYGYSNVMGPPAPTYDVAPDNWDFTGSSSAIPDWSYWG